MVINGIDQDFIWDRRFAVARVKTYKQVPGKFVNRAKCERPKPHVVLSIARICKKQSIRDIEIAKMWVSQARWRMAKAEAEGRTCRRAERRYYECFNHAVPQFHLTKLGFDEYAKRFESGARGEFSHVA